MVTPDKKQKAESGGKRHVPFFLNVHNIKLVEMDAFVDKSAEPEETPEPRSESIYGALASDRRGEQGRLNSIRVNRRNTSYHNIRRILSKAEDEKHEIDIRILKFQRTQQLLADLQRVLEVEAGQAVPEPLPQTQALPAPGELESVPETSGLRIETSRADAAEPGPGIQSDLKSRARAIFERHFAKRVRRLRAEGDGKIDLVPEPFDPKRHLVRKIKELRVLESIYEVNKRKKTRVVEILMSNLHPRVVGRLRERVAEKLDVLLRVKAHLTRTSWKRRLENNFYRSLDARSGSLQQTEKKHLSSKYFVNNILDAERRIARREQTRYWTRVFRPEVSLAPVADKSGSRRSIEEAKESGGKATDHNEMYESFIQAEGDEEVPDQSGPVEKEEDVHASEDHDEAKTVEKEAEGEWQSNARAADIAPTESVEFAYEFAE